MSSNRVSSAIARAERYGLNVPRSGASVDVYKTSDNVYYNVTIPQNLASTYNLPNPTGGMPTPAQFLDVRDSPIVENPEDYYLSVIRFQVPGQEIPIGFWPGYNNQAGVTGNTGPNGPNNTNASITLSSGGFDKQQFIQWQTQNYASPTGMTAPAPPLNGNN